jgi:hypothetical protein
LPLLLVLLGTCPPHSWLELVSVLAERVIKGSWVWKSPSSLDEFDHLSPFGDLDGFGLVLVVSRREWGTYYLV